MSQEVFRISLIKGHIVTVGKVAFWKFSPIACIGSHVNEKWKKQIYFKKFKVLKKRKNCLDRYLSIKFDLNSFDGFWDNWRTTDTSAMALALIDPKIDTEAVRIQFTTSNTVSCNLLCISLEEPSWNICSVFYVVIRQIVKSAGCSSGNLNKARLVFH